MKKILLALARLGFRFFRLLTRFKVHILPVHYYSPLPDLVQLAKSRKTWAKKSALPGIDSDLDGQIRTLRKVCLPRQKEFAGNPHFKYANQMGFGLGYGYVEAQVLHAVIRQYKPRRIVEVGSGVSTYCMLKADEANVAAGNAPAAITCIEPYPSKVLRENGQITLLAKKVQDVEPDVFLQLKKNDLLFIDSSHTVKPGSDVNLLVLEILPRLAPGVIVHFHDIYLPYDYNRDVLHSFYPWMETSLVRAFLVNNRQFKILFCLSQLHYDRTEELGRILPEYRPQGGSDGLEPDSFKPFTYSKTENHFPSSLYIQAVK